MLAAEGRKLALGGPVDPAGVFIFDVDAVMFTPIDRSRSNAVVVLYTRSQIGPDHGSEHLALVYKVTADAATRQPALEHPLEGVVDAAQARRRLAKR